MLKVEGLSKTFFAGNNRVPVIRNVSFTVNAGEIVAIHGQSGAGKSTLLYCVAGLEEADAGELFFMDQPLHGLGETALARLRGRHMGFVFQSFRLLPTLTAEENVRLPLELGGHDGAEKKAREWLAEVGLEHRSRHYPTTLSGGEQQRLAIARALCVGPDLILADEPTGNLDSENGRHVMELMLAAVRRHRTALLLVTHEMDLIPGPHRALLLSDGRIVKEELRGQE